MSARFEANGTASLTRRIAAGVVIVVGVVLLISTFANNLFKVGPDFEEMIDDFRPMLAEESIATARADLAMLGAVGTEFETAIVPALSQQLGMSSEEFVGFTAAEFPDVSNGIAALPEIVPTFNGLIDSLDSQRALFESADQIPTKDLPATTVPWGLFLAGIALIVAGVLLYKPGWLGLASVGTLGVLIVVVTLILSLIPKAADADDLNANLEPIYTPELVAQAGGALATVSAMGTQMQTEMLPVLAEQLGMGGDQLNTFLGENFPATAQALGTLPEALGRFDGLVTNFENNLDNYETLKPVGFSSIIYTLFIGGLVTLAAFAAAWWAGRKEDAFVGVDRLASESMKDEIKV
ncbi:MAG: hypothetical protein HKN80_12310 [Acidimicrobiia bacterium]|nr:hypothetical protein [Acidimicrobiia bacterium]